MLTLSGSSLNLCWPSLTPLRRSSLRSSALSLSFPRRQHATCSSSPASPSLDCASATPIRRRRREIEGRLSSALPVPEAPRRGRVPMGTQTARSQRCIKDSGGLGPQKVSWTAPTRSAARATEAKEVAPAVTFTPAPTHQARTRLQRRVPTSRVRRMATMRARSPAQVFAPVLSVSAASAATGCPPTRALRLSLLPTPSSRR